MTRSALLTSTAVALLLGLAPASAQTQQKEEKSGPSQMQQERSQQGASQSQESQGRASKESAEKKSEPREKATKGSARKDTEPKAKSTEGSAERSEPKDKASKASAEKSTEPRDKAIKGTAEKSPESKEKTTKGTAEKGPESKDNAAKGTAGRDAPASDKAAGTERSGSAQRVQITEEKRTNIHQTILKDRNVNRVTNVNFSINIGTRVPRTVRLELLPASVITIVPEYRSYRYFVVDDQICIVEPSTYEIVEVIRVSDRTASLDNRGGPARLVLTEEEKAFLLREIDLRGESTLGIGVLVEGNEVPRDVTLRTFPATVVERIPKLRDHNFITAENRLAIVDQRGSKVELVIEARR
jgi:DNA mismatch repair ATPase MutL